MPTSDYTDAYSSPERQRAGQMGGLSGYAVGAAYEHGASITGHRERVAAMRKSRTHWSVAAGEAIWRGLAHLPTWRVAAGVDEDLQAEMYRAHVDACLGVSARGPTGTRWSRLLDETLTAALLGFGVWEVWGERHADAWWPAVELRDQGSIYRWVTERGRLVAVEQVPQSDGGMLTLPAESLVTATYHPQAADDYSGVGVLRPVLSLYGDVVHHLNSYKAGSQRWAMPTPVVRIDPEKARNIPGITVDAAWVAAESMKWAEVAHNLSGCERSYLVLPPWVTFEVYGGDLRGGLSEAQAAIDSTDRRILSVLSGSILMLGTSNAGGTQALSSTLYSAAHDSAQALCEWICEVWDPLIDRALAWRFGEIDPALRPRLTFDGLAAKSFVEWVKSGSLVALVQAGLITPDAGMEADLRSVAELKPLDPKTARRQPRAVGATVYPTGVSQ